MASTIHLTCEDVTTSNTDNQCARPTFLSHFNQAPAVIVRNSLIQQEHSYAKQWSSLAELHRHAKPACHLFMAKHPRSYTEVATVENDEIDVDTVEEINVLPYDQEKACALMNECERNVNFARATEVPDDTWEETVNKEGWTTAQTRLFNRVVKALQGHRLAQLAFSSHANEPIMRRLCVDKTAKRVRQILAAAMWDQSTMLWLHSKLIESLGQSMLAVYLAVLQVLRSKALNLVEILTSANDSCTDKAGAEALRLLLKRPWDPVGSFMSLHRLSKLPGGASFVMIPDVVTDFSDAARIPAAVWRTKFWNSQLSGLGKVTHISIGTASTLSQYVTATETAVRMKCKELRERHPNRAVVLIGWQAGGMIACRVSLVEAVTAVVVLGFPTQFISGRICGDADDLLLDCRTPTLFVVGQDATTCCIDDLEDMREHMQTDTSLVVVGGADDRLRMSHSRRRTEGLTQRMVDRCILDKIADFLNEVVEQHVSLDDATQVKHPSPRRVKSSVVTGRYTAGHECDSADDVLNVPRMPRKSLDTSLSAEPHKRVVKRKKKSNITLTTKRASPVSVDFASVAPSRAVLDQHASAAIFASLSLPNPISCPPYSIQSCGIPLLKPTFTGFPAATAANWMLTSSSSILPASTQFHQLLASLSTTRLPVSEIMNPLLTTAQNDGSVSSVKYSAGVSGTQVDQLHVSTLSTSCGLPQQPTLLTSPQSVDGSDQENAVHATCTRTRTVKTPKYYE